MKYPHKVEIIRLFKGFQVNVQRDKHFPLDEPTIHCVTGSRALRKFLKRKYQWGEEPEEEPKEEPGEEESVS